MRSAVDCLLCGVGGARAPEGCNSTARAQHKSRQYSSSVRVCAAAALCHRAGGAVRFRVDAEYEYESVVASLVGQEWTQALGQAQ